MFWGLTFEEEQVITNWTSNFKDDIFKFTFNEFS